MTGESSRSPTDPHGGNHAPVLATNFNTFLITFYIFFTNLGYNIGNAIGFLKYLQDWGLTITGMVNATILGFIVKFCCQLWVGYYGDKMKSKYGRRKPFLVAGYVVKSVALLLLTMPAFKGGVAVFGWYTLFYMLFQLGSELSDSPFDAWMIERTKDDQDYRKIYSVAGPIGGFLGGISGLVLTMYYPLIGSLIFVVGGGFFTYLVVAFITSNVLRTQPTLPELVPSLRICARTNEFKSIFGLRVLVDSGINIFVTVVGYYVLIGFNLETIKSFINYLLLGSLIGACIGIPLTVLLNWILYRFDKISLYMWLIKLVIILGVVAFIVTIPQLNSFVGYFIVLCFMNTLSYPAKLFDRLIIRDLVTYDTFMTGLNRENMYLMALTLPTTILSTFIGGIPAMIIAFSGYSEDTDVDDDKIDEKYEWTNSTLWILRISGSLVFSVLGVMAYMILKRYPLTSTVAQQMNDVNKRREEEKRIEEEETAEYERLHSQNSASNPLQTSLLNSNFATNDISLSTNPNSSVKYLFLNFSVEELYFMANFTPPSLIPSSSSVSSFSSVTSALTLHNFFYIRLLNSLMLYLGTFAAVCVIAVIVVDIYRQQGGLSTLFINVLMILIFFVVYCLFRYQALRTMIQTFQLQTHSSESLSISSPSSMNFHTTVQLIYHDFTNYHQTLREMLKQEEIFTTDYYSRDQSSSLLDPITDENSERKLHGFKRIFSLLFLIILVSIVIVSIELI